MIETDWLIIESEPYISGFCTNLWFEAETYPYPVLAILSLNKNYNLIYIGDALQERLHTSWGNLNKSYANIEALVQAGTCIKYF